MLPWVSRFCGCQIKSTTEICTFLYIYSIWFRFFTHISIHNHLRTQCILDMVKAGNVCVDTVKVTHIALHYDGIPLKIKASSCIYAFAITEWKYFAFKLRAHQFLACLWCDFNNVCSHNDYILKVSKTFFMTIQLSYKYLGLNMQFNAQIFLMCLRF